MKGFEQNGGFTQLEHRASGVNVIHATTMALAPRGKQSLPIVMLKAGVIEIGKAVAKEMVLVPIMSCNDAKDTSVPEWMTGEAPRRKVTVSIPE